MLRVSGRRCRTQKYTCTKTNRRNNEIVIWFRFKQQTALEYSISSVCENTSYIKLNLCVYHFNLKHTASLMALYFRGKVMCVVEF